MRKLILWLCFLPGMLAAQDPQLSQYYSAPLILNPAMAGETDCYRVGFNGRNQWTSLPGGAFNTASVFLDYNYDELRSGFGVLALHDEIGTPRMTSNEISGFYSFLAQVSSQLNFRMGLQASYVARSLDYSRLIFEDQFSGINVLNNVTNDAVRNYDKKQYGDFSSGILMFGEDTYWIGFSAHHLLRPQQGFYKESELPIKYSLHGGYSFNVKRDDKPRKNQNTLNIIPTFMYKAQAKYDQLDLGIYFVEAPVMVGVWYRGILAKRDFKVFNQDAVNVQAGALVKNFIVAYSYDFTVSRLGQTNTKGSHEISLIYTFCADWPKKKSPPRRTRRLPCPDFQRSLKYDGTF